jgi:hypothetical protein
MRAFAFPLRTPPSPEGLIAAQTLLGGRGAVNEKGHAPVHNDVDKRRRSVDVLWTHRG